MLLGLGKRSCDIVPEVLYVLNSDTHADESRYHSGLVTNIFGYEHVAGIEWALDEALYSTEACCLEDEVEITHEVESCLVASLDNEGHHTSSTGDDSLCDLVIRT